MVPMITIGVRIGGIWYPMIDYLLLECHIIIASSMEEEVAVLGADYPDGVAAGERIAGGDI
jgi:hypothetical protein